MLTGDLLLPGRIYVDDVDAFRASSRRLRAFAEERSVSLVLGGHLEMDSEAGFYRPGATYHPDERPLQLGHNDLVKLDEASRRLGRFTPYLIRDSFAIVNYQALLPAAGALLLLGVVVLGLGIWLFINRRRRRMIQAGK